VATIKLVSLEDTDKLQRFYNAAYGTNHIMNNSLHHDWQFLSNPYNNLNTKSIVVAEDNDEFIAHMGMIPVPIKIYNETKLGVWHVSYFTLEKYRGIGLGTKMVKFSDSLFDCIGGLGNSDASNNIHIKNNGKNFDNINRYIKVLNKENMENFLHSKINFTTPHYSIDNELVFERINVLNHNYDLFWNSIKDIFPITIDRTKKYISWKYFEHPLIDYHFMTLSKNNEIFGYAILRFEDNNLEIKAGRIVDFISLPNFEKELLQNVIEYFENKVDFIDFYCSGLFYRTTLEYFGFFNNLSTNYTIPTVFNPLNKERNSINFHFKIKNIPIDNEKYYDSNNLFFVKADADQDRAF
jgi:hypothetical protein